MKFCLLLLLTIGVLGLSVCVGSRRYGPGDVWRALTGPQDDPRAVIVGQFRVPRALLAALVGGGLAVSGVLMQGLFRNPLADPALVGVSAGGALGGVLALHFHLASIHFLLLPLCSLGGALGCALLAFGLSVRHGRSSTASLLLAGLGVGTLATACTSLLLSQTQEYALRNSLAWLMGGLEDRSWAHVRVSAAFIVPAVLASGFLARPLDLLAQGEEVASSLGVEVGRLRFGAVLCAAAAAGAAVSVSGIVPFVGLVVPHLVRGWAGAAHGRVLPLSFLAGAALVGLADTATRLLPAGTELRLGVLTSLIGAPFFLFLIRRSGRDADR